jgi:alpha-amylase
LYDLGEFDQKGSVATKFGTKDDLLSLSKKAKELGIGLLFDAVLNHKAGADHKERCKVIEVDENGSRSPFPNQIKTDSRT